MAAESTKQLSEEAEKEAEKNPLREALGTFSKNLGALRVFVGEIARLADEHDKKVIEDFLNSMGPIFGPDFLEQQQRVLSDSIKPAAEETPKEGLPRLDSPSQSEAQSNDSAIVQIKAPNPLDDPKKLRALIRAVDAMQKRHPEQGGILRRGAVVSLMTHFEALVADLIHAFYKTHPAALPADERSLTLAELRALGSLDEAQAYLVSQEVDSVLRETLDRQFDYFIKRPKVDLTLLNPYRAEVLETDQRRNLYVHNRGVVNRRYLERVDKELLKKGGAEEGNVLESYDDYVVPAIDRALLAGVALGQLCWRKWRPDEAGEADSQLIDTIYQELLAKRHELVMELTKFAESVKLADDENRKIVVVNHAIALRDTGRNEEVNTLLAATDWTACSLRFRVALDVLRGKQDDAIKALRKAVAADEIHAHDLRDWPLFQPLREQTSFAGLFAELFPGELLQEPPLANESNLVLQKSVSLTKSS